MNLNLINRDEYLAWLHAWRDKQIIKVVSGVRRCGKSTLFTLFKNQLLENGIRQEQIISINFEAIEYEALQDYHQLYNYIVERLQEGQKNYIFLDEVQHCHDYQKAVDSLFIKDSCDIYLTGSNAYFMSGELATVLSGRYVELKMLPLSFKEFVSGLEQRYLSLSLAEKFNLYLSYGAFPFIVRYDSFGEEAVNYLQDVYNTIILKDVVNRLKIADITSLDRVTRFMAHNIGNIFSTNKIENTMKSAGKSIDNKTIDKYLQGLVDALFLYRVSRYNIKGKQILTNLPKYFLVDTGMRNILTRNKDSDIGHIIENITYLELMRRGYEVYVGDVEKGEVDFVAIKNGQNEYYQISASTLNEDTLARELEPLKKIGDNYPKYLLTLDEVFADVNYDGVQKCNLLKWLLQGN